MKNCILLLCCWTTALVLQAQAPPGRDRPDIRIRPNAELLGLAYFIAFEGAGLEKDTITVNGQPVPKKEWHNFGYRLYRQYGRHAGSAHLARSFAVADHLWLDYLLQLLLQVPDFPNARLPPDLPARYFIRFSQSGDTAEARKHAATFLEGLNRFHGEVGFDQYLREHQSFYDAAVQQVAAHLPERDFIGAMETFYGRHFNGYILVPSLALPKGMGFGLHLARNGHTALYNVFGALDRQVLPPGPPDPGFGNRQRLQELSIHEFGHSFVNPVIDSLPPEWIARTEHLFAPVKEAMEQQGYTTWKTCLYEHFVRAGEVLVALSMGDRTGAARLRRHYTEDRQFRYLPEILEGLEGFREKKRTYAGAVARIVAGWASGR